MASIASFSDAVLPYKREALITHAVRARHMKVRRGDLVSLGDKLGVPFEKRYLRNNKKPSFY